MFFFARGFVIDMKNVTTWFHFILNVMNGVATKDVLPFMVNINNKYTRLNTVRLKGKIKEHQHELTNVLDYLVSVNSKYDTQILSEIVETLPYILQSFYQAFLDI